MSGSESNDGLDSVSAAFEYVLGTLTSHERADFEQLIRSDESVQRAVIEWEEQLQGLNATSLSRAPKSDTWAGIERKINAGFQASEAPKPRLLQRLFWLPWALSGTFALLLLVNITLFRPGISSDSDGLPVDYIPVDYMAVMTTDDGKAALSAVAKGDAKRMWLHWGDDVLPADQDYQLWAVSRSDGETRSIAVIASKDMTLLELSEAEWRLIKDSESLMLTIEDEGGSAIDEPSDELVARGLCVRLKSGEHDA